MDSSSQENTCFDCGKSFENNRAFFNHKRVHQKVNCRHCNSSIPVNSKKYHEAKCSGKLDKKFTYSNYFEKTGLTFRHTNGEFTESCHSTLRQSEEKQGLDVKKALGTPVHQSRSWHSLVIFNSKRAGYTKPLRLKKKSSPRVSSPSNDPFSKLFKERFPQAVSLHYQLYKKMKPQNNNL